MAVEIQRSKALDAMNLTPMIDMVFNLLIFFLVTSEFAQQDQQMDLPLPTASEARPLTAQPKEMFVNIDRQGRYFVEGRIVALDELDAILRQAVANNPTNQTVAIRADKRVAFDAVVAVGNLCDKVGIRDKHYDTVKD